MSETIFRLQKLLGEFAAGNIVLQEPTQEERNRYFAKHPDVAYSVTSADVQDDVDILLEHLDQIGSKSDFLIPYLLAQKLLLTLPLFISVQYAEWYDELAPHLEAFGRSGPLKEEDDEEEMAILAQPLEGELAQKALAIQTGARQLWRSLVDLLRLASSLTLTFRDGFMEDLSEPLQSEYPKQWYAIASFDGSCGSMFQFKKCPFHIAASYEVRMTAKMLVASRPRRTRSRTRGDLNRDCDFIVSLVSELPFAIFFLTKVIEGEEGLRLAGELCDLLTETLTVMDGLELQAEDLYFLYMEGDEE